MKMPLLLITILATASATPALAKVGEWPADQLGKETSIPFIRFHGIDDFQNDGDNGVWLRDQRLRWYYAEVSGPCTGLNFATRIGVDTRFNGDRFDRSGVLLVDGERCQVTSLVASEGPPKKHKKG